MKQNILNFPSVKSLQAANGVKTEVSSIHQCKWNRCKEVLESSVDLVRHLENKHLSQIPASGGKTIACRWEGCKHQGLTFSKSVHLHRHVLDRHGGPKPYICARCDKAFGKEMALAQHAALHHRVSSPVPSKGIQKPCDMPKPRVTLHYRRVMPPATKQFDCVDAPILFAIEQWIKRGQCRTRNLPTSIKRKPHTRLKKQTSNISGKRLTETGPEILYSPNESIVPSWTSVSTDISKEPVRRKKFVPPTAITSLLSTIVASKSSE